MNKMLLESPLSELMGIVLAQPMVTFDTWHNRKKGYYRIGFIGKMFRHVMRQDFICNYDTKAFKDYKRSDLIVKVFS